MKTTPTVYPGPGPYSRPKTEGRGTSRGQAATTPRTRKSYEACGTKKKVKPPCGLEKQKSIREQDRRKMTNRKRNQGREKKKKKLST